MSGTAAQEERAKWRANERADRAEEQILSLQRANERLARDLSRFLEAGDLAIEARDAYRMGEGIPIDLYSSMEPLRHALYEARKP